MEILRFIAAWTLLVSSVLRVLVLCDIPAIYNFGDSNSDTGGIAAAFYPAGNPYGQTFFHRPVGRASDGRLIIDFIAEHLKLPYLNAYLDSIGTSSEATFRHGANFATGGATIRRQNESWFETGVSPFPLDIQVEHFVQFKARTTYFYNQAKNTSKSSRLPRPEDFPKALYTFDIGQNDIAAALRKAMSYQQFQAEIPDIVDKFDAAIRQLYGEGAREFWIHNTGPIGCLPVAVVNVVDPKPPGFLDDHGCIKYQNDMALELNEQLHYRVIQLRTELPQADLTYLDIYSAKYGLISNASSQGFENPFNICCGIREKGITVSCGNKGTIDGTQVVAGACANPSRNISWDGVHYTEAANSFVAKQILNGSFSDPPIPITQGDIISTVRNKINSTTGVLGISSFHSKVFNSTVHC